MSNSGYLALITQIFATIEKCVPCPLSQGTLDLIWEDVTQRFIHQLFMQLNSTTVKPMPLCFVSCHIHVIQEPCDYNSASHTL